MKKEINPDSRTNLVQGKLLAKNSVISFFGFSIPMIIAVFAVPLIIKGIGIDRFGVLLIVWATVGYFNFFDIGISRALTKYLAEILGSGKLEDVAPLIWSGLSLLLIFGLIGMLIGIAITPFLVEDLLKIPIELVEETLNTFYLLSLTIPLVILTSGLRGILQAQQKFVIISILRSALGIISFASPLVVLPFSKNLFIIVLALSSGRLLIFFMYFIYCLITTKEMRGKFEIHTSIIPRFLTFGSWSTLSSVVNMLIYHIDRFLIGSILSITAVAYFATPQEIIQKITLIPNSLIGVIFPAFSTMYMKDNYKVRLLFYRSVKFTYLVVFPIVLIIIGLAENILFFWLGEEFARNSTFILQMLTLGFFINSSSQLTYTLIHSAGRPDLTAKISLIEMPLYLLFFVVSLKFFGLKGAATMFVIRIFIDAIVLYLITDKMIIKIHKIFQKMLIIIAASIVVLFLMMISFNIFIKVFVLILVIVSWLIISRMWILDQEEITFITKYLVQLKFIRKFSI